jgi:hypothetical protein
LEEEEEEEEKSKCIASIYFPQYVFKGGLGILQMLMWRYHF